MVEISLVVASGWMSFHIEHIYQAVLYSLCTLFWSPRLALDLSSQARATPLPEYRVVIFAGTSAVSNNPLVSVTVRTISSVEPEDGALAAVVHQRPLLFIPTAVFFGPPLRTTASKHASNSPAGILTIDVDTLTLEVVLSSGKVRFNAEHLEILKCIVWCLWSGLPEACGPAIVPMV